MIKLYFKSSKSQIINSKKLLSGKKKYKIYFWVLKCPQLINTSSYPYVHDLYNIYLHKRLDLLLFQIGFSSSIKQARFLINELKVFTLNSVCYDRNLTVSDTTNLIIKEHFIITLINLILFNMQLRNIRKKKFFWLKKNYYQSKKNMSYLYQLEEFNSISPTVKRKEYSRQVVFDSNYFNLIIL